MPRDDRYGRPGFGRVLLAMAQVWRERRDEALETASSVMAAIEHNESSSGRGGELTLLLVEKIAESALKQFDARNGGFGSQPKFPHPAALDLLLEVGMNRDNEQARHAFATTLEKMACGGVYDQLAGDSIAIRWMSAGWFRTLKRCFTTTRSCCAITYTASRVLSAKIFWRRHARSWHGSTGR